MSRPSNRPVVLVTGSSRGLGRVIATAFGGNGYRVAANYRRDTIGALESTRAIEAAGGEAFPHQADVVDAKAVTAMVSTIIDRWGRLDVLICNAAASADELLVRLSEDSWDRVLGTILTGAFHCLHAAGAVMQRQGRGAVLLIESGPARADEERGTGVGPRWYHDQYDSSRMACNGLDRIPAEPRPAALRAGTGVWRHDGVCG